MNFSFKVKKKTKKKTHTSTQSTLTWLARVDIPPPLNELTGDGPHTGARQHVSVEHTQFQLVLRLLQLPDHLVDELKVTLAVADEGIEQLRGCIQFSSINVSNTTELLIARPALRNSL